MKRNGNVGKTRFIITIREEVGGEVEKYFARQCGARELSRAVSGVVLSRARQFGLMRQALAYIQEHCHRTTLRETEVAHQVGMKSSSFSTLLHRLSGQQYRTHLSRFRAAHARLLLRTGMKVREAARQSGFNYVGSLSPAFRRVYHINPCKYRQNALRHLAKG